MATKIKAWHFLPADRRLRYDDNRLIRKGLRLTVKGPVKLCSHGLHASIKARDALHYAPGPIVCRVEIGGEVLQDNDKIVGTERTVLWWADATHTLHTFACWCAEQSLTSAKVTDERSWNAIAVKLKWLKGEATDAELDAAESAARSAAESAARSAAESAARSAAESAARSAAESAAWSAAWSAARSAAESAAWSAAWSAAESAGWSAAWSAARSAAESAGWSAAWSAARSAHNDKLTAMLNKLKS